MTETTPAASTSAAQTTLILYRGKGYEGIANPFVRPWAYLDDTYTRSCHKGTKITGSVTPGLNKIHTQSEFPNSIKVNIVPGDTACICCTIASGVLSLNWSLTLDDPAQCQKVIATFREQPPTAPSAP